MTSSTPIYRAGGVVTNTVGVVCQSKGLSLIFMGIAGIIAIIVTIVVGYNSGDDGKLIMSTHPDFPMCRGMDTDDTGMRVTGCDSDHPMCQIFS